MVAAGVDSRMLVGRSATKDSTVTAVDPRRFLVASELDRRLWRLQRSPNRTWRSPAVFGSLNAARINALPVDVVNLHWVTDGLLSIAEIGRIAKPMVWTMHDMWPFCGTEHYALDRLDARWRVGYTKESRPLDEDGIDLDRHTFLRKRKAWTTPIPLIPVSSWLADLARQSALAASWPVTVIPNVMDTVHLYPGDRARARTGLGLPSDLALVSFTSSAGIDDQRKGWQHLAAAMPTVAARTGGAGVVVIGPVTDEQRRRDVGFPVFWQGELHGNDALARVLAAVDVAAVPSEMDNLPMTATEAQTSGRPVVGFAAGGVPDTVEHLRTGYLARPFDDADLADGLVMAIEDARGQGAWARQARERALGRWSADAVVPQVLAAYEQAILSR